MEDLKEFDTLIHPLNTTFNLSSKIYKPYIIKNKPENQVRVLTYNI